MSQNQDFFDSQSQDFEQTQSQIKDNFNEPMTIGSSSSFGEPSSYYSKKILYGTTINAQSEISNAKEFLTEYPVESESKLYMNKIREMATTEDYNLNVDMQHVYDYNQSLYKKIIAFPSEMLPLFDIAANEILNPLGGNPN